MELRHGPPTTPTTLVYNDLRPLVHTDSRGDVAKRDADLLSRLNQWIVVAGDYKPGRVTTTVTDLVVPAPGLPIQIQRTYDSLNRSISGDFGYGWTLGMNVQLEISPTSDVTLTLNGQRRTFYFTPPFNILAGITTPAYTAEPGMFGTLTNPSSNCGSGVGFGSSNLVIKTGIIWVCAIGLNLYVPSSFVYTDPYGRVYNIDG